MKISPPNITELSQGQIFVFGSNLSGIHGGGAARTALKWGAQMGNGIGIQGKTYAIPTKSKNITRTLAVNEIRPYVDDFIKFARDNPQLDFLVTEIGCGLAGHVVEDIAPLFIGARELPNVFLPERFIDFLSMGIKYVYFNSHRARGKAARLVDLTKEFHAWGRKHYHEITDEDAEKIRGIKGLTVVGKLPTDREWVRCFTW